MILLSLIMYQATETSSAIIKLNISHNDEIIIAGDDLYIGKLCSAFNYALNK